MEEEKMGTQYGDVVDLFLAKINDYKMLNYSDEDIFEDAVGYLKVAVADFTEKFNTEYAMDDYNLCFEEEIPHRVMDIFSLAMVVEWLKPILYESREMHNVMSLKDATFFSPAKVMEQKGVIYERALEAYEKACMNYTYSKGDLEAFKI